TSPVLRAVAAAGVSVVVIAVAAALTLVPALLGAGGIRRWRIRGLALVVVGGRLASLRSAFRWHLSRAYGPSIGQLFGFVELVFSRP
ncbi:hypothetical protein, partial [Kitasatospora sp. NPDC097643]|uniref:hypothetical protein n=1 Tax=Kitasatospora sp. NPDC097643 TaxID=3157230 RepID=UPI003329C806